MYLADRQEWLDVPRSADLWTDVFQAPKSLIRRGGWIDQPSVGIPFLDIATGATLAQALTETGKADLARQVFNTTREVADAVHIPTETQRLLESTPITSPETATGDTRMGKSLSVKKKKP
jgi:hypothetical protein